MGSVPVVRRLPGIRHLRLAPIHRGTGPKIGPAIGLIVRPLLETVRTTRAIDPTILEIALTGRAIARTTGPAIGPAIALTTAVMIAAMTGATNARVGRAIVADVARVAALLVFIALTLAGIPRCWAAESEALEYFAEAKAAFDAEDFSRARALFERALAAGMEGPAVHYNIGAAAFRAGDLPRAERAFRDVARTPSMAALAQYNLGLVALDRRDPQEARDWFERSLHANADERLKALSARRLEDLPRARATGSASAWSYYARGGAGFDDNIALRSESLESSATGDEDSYGELNVAGNYSYGPWRLDAGAGMLEYLDLDEFSQTSLYLGAARGFRLDNWHFELGAYGSQLSFGGEVFERNTAAGLLVTRMFYGGGRLRAQLRAASVDGKGLFTGLTGDRRELGVYFDKGWHAWYFTAHTRTEINDSVDDIFATRWIQLGGEARYAFSPIWGFSAGAALRRTSRPALSDTLDEWDDDRVSVQLGVTRALAKQAQLFVRFDHERNDSPVQGFDYDRNRLSASVEYWY
jgi:tetratricopeptide (TPR) repeat protein